MPRMEPSYQSSSCATKTSGSIPDVSRSSRFGNRSGPTRLPSPIRMSSPNVSCTCSSRASCSSLPVGEAHMRSYGGYGSNGEWGSKTWMNA